VLTISSPGRVFESFVADISEAKQDRLGLGPPGGLWASPLRVALGFRGWSERVQQQEWASGQTAELLPGKVPIHQRTLCAAASDEQRRTLAPIDQAAAIHGND
jgi:hypothetical protein